MSYLLGAIVLSALLVWLVAWWHRRPKSMAKAIDEFRQARQAIAPRPPETRRRLTGESDAGHRNDEGGPEADAEGRR